jgi:CubicO group peptidase (beta-lactamase class C family)
MSDLAAVRFRAPLAIVVMACCACRAPAPPPRVVPEQPRAAASVDTGAGLARMIDPLFAQYAKPGVPGCAVGVYRAGEIVFARGYGAASLENGVAIDRATLFNIGSISKQFTAAALLLLVQDGKVSLDDDVRKYIPELPDFGHPIRVHHLLHHTSGMRDVYSLLPLEGFMPPDLADDDDGLYALAHQKGPISAPGTEWRYSNTGYFLAALIVKRVTGEPFSEVARKRIFEPLGMTSTVVLDDHRRVLPHRATGYAPGPDGEGFRVDAGSSELVGATLVYSSIADLARWDANFYTPSVGGAPMLEAMRTPGKLDDGKPFPIAYGMGLDERPAGTLAQEEHTGEDAGFTADLVRYPTRRLTVACLCNDVSADAIALAHSVAAVLLPELAGATPPLPSGGAAPAADAGKMSVETVEAALGAYYDPQTFDIRTLSRDKDAVVLTLGLHSGSPTRVLEPTGAHTFRVQGGSTRYVVDVAGKSLTRFAENADPQKLVRFDPITLPPPALTEYTGRFECDELLRDMRVSIVDGGLELGPWGRVRGGTRLDPVARDVFGGAAGGLPSAVKLEYRRDRTGRTRAFELTTDGMTFRFTRRTE